MKLCDAKRHDDPEHLEYLERRGFIVPAEVKALPRPPAVIEWFDPVVQRWRPLCVDCQQINDAIGAQADRELGNEIAIAARKAVGARYREVQE